MEKKNKQSASQTKDRIFTAIFIGIIIFVVWSVIESNAANTVPYSKAVQLFHQEQVSSFAVKGNKVILNLREAINGETTVQSKLSDVSILREDLGSLILEQQEKGILKEYDYLPGSSAPWWATLIPYVLILIAILFLWAGTMSSAMGGMAAQDKQMQFGKSNPRGPDKNRKVTFADVAGADEEKEELQEVVSFLKEPKKYLELGARIPKGILLVGPPGTGKTLLAKAVAGEANVGFLSISGSDFVEMFVGVGASRVRDLFEKAKKIAPAIVFIDEIDAVGRQRGTGLGGSHDEREQTLNQLLVEMDGFEINEGVVVLAATNRADILDPALLRPGRFDRQVYVGLPDMKGREEILHIHAKNKPLSEDVDLNKLAKTTAGFTGADLENLMNEGALLAARKDAKFVCQADLEEAVIKVIAGPEKKSRIIPEKERRLTAYHEAGHALVMKHLPTCDPVHQISIIPRGKAGGMTISLPTEDRSYLSRSHMEEEIVSLLGGRVAEKLMLGDISTGASNDISRATQIARKMVTAYGMSDVLGTVSFEAQEQEVFIGRSMGTAKSYSEDIAAQIDKEIKRIIDQAYARCESILSEEKEALTTVAEYLLEQEVVSGQELDALLAGKDPRVPQEAEESALETSESKES